MDVVRETFFWSFRYFLKQLIDNGRSAWSDRFGESSSVYHDYYETDRVINPSIHAADIKILSLTSINIWIFICLSLSRYTHTCIHTNTLTYTLSPFHSLLSLAFSLSLSLFLSLPIHSLPIQTYSAFPLAQPDIYSIIRHQRLDLLFP